MAKGEAVEFEALAIRGKDGRLRAGPNSLLFDDRELHFAKHYAALGHESIVRVHVRVSVLEARGEKKEG